MKTISTGIWTDNEDNLFVQGCIEHGWGHWKEIANNIQSRSANQVKSHAQKLALNHPEKKKWMELEHAQKQVKELWSAPNYCVRSSEAGAGRNTFQSTSAASPIIHQPFHQYSTFNPFHPLSENISAAQQNHWHEYPNNVMGPSRKQEVTNDTVFIVPTQFDVICALGEAYSVQHSGNRHFQTVIELNLNSFRDANEDGKKVLFENVLSIIKTYGGRFVQRRDSGQWKVASDAFARHKIKASFVSFMEVRGFH
jgi:SHAQKYF class myb-like DNA-binding protein